MEEQKNEQKKGKMRKWGIIVFILFILFWIICIVNSLNWEFKSYYENWQVK